MQFEFSFDWLFDKLWDGIKWIFNWERFAQMGLIIVIVGIVLFCAIVSFTFITDAKFRKDLIKEIQNRELVEYTNRYNQCVSEEILPPEACAEYAKPTYRGR